MNAPTPLANLSFPTPGNYPDEDPAAGLEDTLRLFEFGERLAFDGAWIRQRHLEHGVGSAAVFLAAAGQRTRRIQLGTAVIPIGYESPFRLAEDLAMADVLSGGRLQPRLQRGYAAARGADRGSRLRRRLARLRPLLRADRTIDRQSARRLPGRAGYAHPLPRQYSASTAAAARSGVGRSALVRRREHPVGPLGRCARVEPAHRQYRLR
ncbi:LLM class flavin-dependent oxidoreductase [Nocardia grenadensis]|uniref:LLM class flavin-dependent oxidoreductase n=1 Tax=Nocardia grenadensis TaxID=931537 RepID=UPI003D7223DF